MRIHPLAALLLAAPAFAGPLNPPAGPVAPTPTPLADIEPRSPLNDTTAPGNANYHHVIVKSGSYFLADKLTVANPRGGVLIAADDVTLDLNGFSIIGPGIASATGDGVFIQRLDSKPANNIVIRNGIITGTASGVEGLLASGEVEHLVIERARNFAIRFTTNIADGTTPAIRIDECTLRNNGSIDAFQDTGGIFVQAGALVTNCRIEDTIGIGLYLVNASTATRNHVAGIAAPTGLTASAVAVYGDRCTLIDNVFIAPAPGVRAIDCEGANHVVVRNVFGGSVNFRGTNHVFGPSVTPSNINAATNPFANINN